MVKRIALIGPESTGKTLLTQQLALHYKTNGVTEYARTYLSGLNRKYELNDILTIAQNQLKQENQRISTSNNFIFVDTEMIINKVWCLDVFKTCPDWILDQTINNPYDLYLLTYPDLPWQHDPLRENPNRREFFFNWYKREIEAINRPLEIIKGLNEIRLQNAIQAIEKHFG